MTFSQEMWTYSLNISQTTWGILKNKITNKVFKTKKIVKRRFTIPALKTNQASIVTNSFFSIPEMD